jgi:hypothetical protein
MKDIASYRPRYRHISAVQNHLVEQFDLFDKDKRNKFNWLRLEAHDLSDIKKRLTFDLACEADNEARFELDTRRKAKQAKRSLDTYADTEDLPAKKRKPTDNGSINEPTEELINTIMDRFLGDNSIISEKGADSVNETNSVYSNSNSNSNFGNSMLPLDLDSMWFPQDSTNQHGMYPMHPDMYPTYQQDMQMASQGTQMASQSTQTVPPGTHMAPQTIPTGTHMAPQTIPPGITQNPPAEPKSNTTNPPGMSFDERVSRIGTADVCPRNYCAGFKLDVGDVTVEVSWTGQVKTKSLVQMVTGPIKTTDVAYKRVRLELLDQVVDPPPDWESAVGRASGSIKQWIPIECVRPWAESQGLIGLIDRLQAIAGEQRAKSGVVHGC